jgi:hypothetical protein
MCEKALDAARQVAEKKLVMDVVKRYPTIEMLKVTNKALQMPELKEDATQAAASITQKAGGKGRGKRGTN